MRAMSPETRNLLGENNLYRWYEFTSLRQLVIIVNLVTIKPPILTIVAAFLLFLHIFDLTCSREILSGFTER